jgi:hypothetical protein
MPLTEKQLKGAWMLANGRTDAESYQAAGVAMQTFYKWKKKPEFMAAVKFLAEQKETEIARKIEELVSLESARDDEERALGYQRLMVSELGQLSVDLIKQIRADGVEQLGANRLGPIVKAFSDSVNMLQATNDRLIGLESLIEDVSQIEEKIQIKAQHLEKRERDKAEGGGAEEFFLPHDESSEA